MVTSSHLPCPRPFALAPWLRQECAPDSESPPLIRRAHRPRTRARDRPLQSTLHWIVDGHDVATCRVTDDPCDERSLFRKLAILLDIYARTHGDPVTAIFDGEPFSVVSSGKVSFDLEFVPRQERSEALARAIARSPRPQETYVATANPAVGFTARQSGAQVIPPRVFRGWLESLRW
jgi:hypothetical protein